jgi:predicted nucleic acid-binding protein
MEALPSWVEVRSVKPRPEAAAEGLDAGEAGVIDLAVELDAELVLIDERAAVAVARGKGLNVTGTVGVLMMAAERGLLDRAQTVARLRQTNFRCREEIYDQLLADAAETGDKR